MDRAFKPSGYNSVSPYLIVNGAAGTVAFLSSVFGGVELQRFATPEGRIMHAEVKIDDSVIMLADATEDWQAIASNVHIYVRDVDEIYRRAIAAGGVSVQAPTKKSDPDRRGGVKDAGGTTWWMATRLE